MRVTNKGGFIMESRIEEHPILGVQEKGRIVKL